MTAPPPESFEDYVSARWARLVRSAVLMGVDLYAAEDAAQVTLTRCYLAWDRVTKARDPDAYVHRILINTINESRRRRWSQERATDAVPDRATPDGSGVVDDSLAVLSALRSLPEAQRQVVVLRFYSDLTEADTAAALRIPVGTVKSRAARGLAALAQHPAFADDLEAR